MRKRGCVPFSPRCREPTVSCKPQDYFVRARRWWTGEDSNLRSPQGAADLQSAGFSHSPTRPALSAGTQLSLSLRGMSQCRKSSCPETPAPTLLSREIRPYQRKKSRPIKFSWRRESNPRPSDYKSDALPAELRQHTQTQQKYHRGN